MNRISAENPPFSAANAGGFPALFGSTLIDVLSIA
jgi:hypothetical protein